MKETETMAWYGVKTLYRQIASGEPVPRPSYYKESATLLEERVVLFRAESFDEAITLAEDEAQAFAAKCQWVNHYGQQVTMEYLECCNAYRLSNPPGERAEVYSKVSIFDASVSIDRIVEARLGEPFEHEEQMLEKFLNRKFADQDV